jgi:hypothetical protein
MNGPNDIGVGATKELTLRVSVASLVEVLFESPDNGRQMLALERAATLQAGEEPSDIAVTTKPFGGAVRLISPHTLKDVIGDFHYDSDRSRHEGDFRIQINPDSWQMIKEICRQNAKETGRRILDSSPERELAEEFEDCLKIRITPDQYDLQPRDLVVEEIPLETDNMRARGVPTVRVYYIYEARIKSAEVISRIVFSDSERLSNEHLREMAREDSRRGGRGKANAIVTLALDDVMDAYTSIPLEGRSKPVRVGQYRLDGNVPAILQNIDHPRYQRYL